MIQPMVHERRKAGSQSDVFAVTAVYVTCMRCTVHTRDSILIPFWFLSTSSVAYADRCARE